MPLEVDFSYDFNPENASDKDTIVAQATAPGRSSIGIIKVSGPKVKKVINNVLKKELSPRYAHHLPFFDEKNRIVDEGLAIYFPSPNSFTGEDVLELHGHGGPVVINMLINIINKLGIRLARPGEFSERAFLNDKIDLSQAEAIADLIDSASEQAARSAIQSLQGVFSKRIHSIVDLLVQLRTFIEAAIDFPEEEIDFLKDVGVKKKLALIEGALKSVLREASQGALLRDGMTVVIAGEPNAGKSSLLNALAGKETAIVTNIAGTTRDILRENIHISGLPLHIMDTAGLRSSSDEVEQIGVERALKAVSEADLVLLVLDNSTALSADPRAIWPELVNCLPSEDRITIIRNKIDLTGDKAGINHQNGNKVINISAKTGMGIELLKEHLKESMGFHGAGENSFTARRRHIEALKEAQTFVKNGQQQLIEFGAGELLAEDLRMAQKCLGKITGEFSSEDLLGCIFSSFCIGK